MTPRPPYRPLRDYALIGNTHSAALVATDGSIDFACLPHFDSGAVFCRLLDAAKGGFFQVSPKGPFETSRRYVPGTAVLETSFKTAGGTLRLTDFMHSQRIAESRLGVDHACCHRLLRKLDAMGGRIDATVTFKPTFDFARAEADIQSSPGIVVARSGGSTLSVECSTSVQFRPAPGGALAVTFAVHPGKPVWVVLSQAPAAHFEAARSTASTFEEQHAQTLRNWGAWSALCTYDGPYHELVRVSARVLKLLTFGPTGALVAAPTTSLPEEIGGVRNWDYRFTWLRDSALILYALQRIGYHEAATDFFRWLERVSANAQGEPQIMYTIAGDAHLPELELTHLEGYRGSAPVRIGNGAATQLQLDTYGHVLDAAFTCFNRLHPFSPELGQLFSALAQSTASRWRLPDHGIWEVRGDPRHFVSSKVLCWVALDRAVKLVERAGLPGDVEHFRRERDKVRAAILQHGFDAGLGAFVQSFGSQSLDASALLMPLVGFLPADDERMLSTVARVTERLTSNGLVHRYLDDDGLAGGEGTFAICTFWLVDNLAMQGRVDEARALFEHVTSFASDLGLFAEQIDENHGELLGNYPQGFTHLALIRSALAISEAENRLTNTFEPTAAAHQRST